METTLEVRWFVKGIPPATVQRWFRFECPGKLLERLETKKDWYAYFLQDRLDEFARFSSHLLNREQVNLKLRQGNLELKLREQEFGTHRFSHLKNSAKNSHICEGKVEQWCKFGEPELKDSTSSTHHSLNETAWVRVDKERKQKIEQDVRSELTCLKIDSECWWSVAFEMTKKNPGGQQDNCFKEVVERACKTYYGPRLSTINSYSYSKWLLELAPQTIPYQKLDVRRRKA